MTQFTYMTNNLLGHNTVRVTDVCYELAQQKGVGRQNYVLSKSHGTMTYHLRGEGGVLCVLMLC